MTAPFRISASVLALLLAAAAVPVFTAGEPEAAIVVDLLLRTGASPYQRVSSRPLCVQADPPEIYREPFISGAGNLTRVVSLEYQIRLQRNDARGLLLELSPVSYRFTPARRLEIPRDGRSKLLSAWRDDPSGSEAMFSVRLADSDEALLACTLRRPLVRPLYHIRATIEQAGPGRDPSRSAPQFTAPLGEESSEHFVNTQPRKIERKKADAPAVGPVAPQQPMISPGIAVRDFGESGGGTTVQTTVVPLSNPEPAATPPTPPAPADPGAAGEPVVAAVVPPEPPDVVIVEDRDDFTVTVKADRAGERLKIRVTVTGSLATATERRAAVNLTQNYTVFRHEPMSLFILGDGALHSYTMSFDPDWNDQ